MCRLLTFLGAVVLGLGTSYATVDADGLKPCIVSVDNVTKEYVGTSAFILSFDVVYTGAESLLVEVEEEFNTTLRSYRFDEPDFVHVTTGAITVLYKSWVTISAENEFGLVSSVMEFEPDGSPLVQLPVDSVTPQSVELLTLQGSVVFRGDASDLLSADIPSGVYIRRITFPDGRQPLIDKMICR